MDILPLVSNILSLGSEIYNRVEKVEINKEQCRCLAKRVRFINNTIRELMNSNSHPFRVNYISNVDNGYFINGLEDLNETLNSALRLVSSFTESYWLEKLFKAGKDSEKFDHIYVRLDGNINQLNLGINIQQLFDEKEGKEAAQKDWIVIQLKQDEILRLNHEAKKDIQRLTVSAENHYNILLQKFESMQVGINKLTNEKPIGLIDKEKFESICIPYEEIKQEKALSCGGLGTIYLGKWNYINVVIKEFDPKKISEKSSEEFEQNILVMKELRYRHIILLYGVCVGLKNCLIMEYCSKGSLYDFLQSHQEIALSKRIKWTLEIAKGLSYLHGRKPLILHRDLKSPNILIDEHQCAKISTSTLKKEIAGNLEWMAPEIIMESEKETRYTKAADIYSYGMIVWELATQTIPYEKVQDSFLLAMKILQGEREELPLNTPTVLAKIITGCWKQIPEERLSIDEVITTLALEDANQFTNYAEELDGVIPSIRHNDDCEAGLPSISCSSDPTKDSDNSLHINNNKKNYYENAYSQPADNQSIEASAGTPVSCSSFSNQSNNLVPEIKKLNINPLKPAISSSKTTSSPPVKTISKEVSIPSLAFGKEKWEKYFGDIGVEPPLPTNINEILSMPCPYIENKKIAETHLLTLIPSTINGQSLTLSRFKELIKSPKSSGYSTEYSKFTDGDYDRNVTKSYWVLMTKNCIPNSPNQSFQDQQLLLDRKYTIPTTIEAVISIVTYYVEKGEKLYANNPTYIRCREMVDKQRMTVGNFNKDGIEVTNSCGNKIYDYIGKLFFQGSAHDLYGISGIFNLSD